MDIFPYLDSTVQQLLGQAARSVRPTWSKWLDLTWLDSIDSLWAAVMNKSDRGDDKTKCVEIHVGRKDRKKGRLRTFHVVQNNQRPDYVYLLSFSSFINEQQCTSLWGLGQRATEGCQVRKSTGGRRILTRDLHFHRLRPNPLEHDRLHV